MHQFTFKICLAVVFAACIHSFSCSAVGQDDTVGKRRYTFLRQHCFDCHDESTSEGNLNLKALVFNPPNHANFKIWERIFDRVRAGEMPPAGETQPIANAKALFLSQLKTPLMAADRKDKQEKGRVQVRRLTRREYEHTIHDLLGVDLPLKELLPEDQVTHGFETVAAGQQLSHFTLASYLDAADRALGEAFARLANGDVTFSRTLPAAQLGRTPRYRGNYRGPEVRDGVAIAWPIRLQFYGRMNTTRVPAAGWYRVTLKNIQSINPTNGVVWGTLRSGACNSAEPIMYSIGLVEATAEKRDLTFDAWIRRGHLLELKPNDVSQKPARNGPPGTRGGSVSYEGMNHEANGLGGIAFSAINLERIYPNAARWQVRRNLLGGLTKEEIPKLSQPDQRAAIMRRVITNFAARAFRRPVSETQVAPYIDMAMKVLREPDARALTALRVAYRAMLCSPRFLTLIEQPGPLDNHALAARLSYALWNSMPDRQLRSLADAGKLSDSKVFGSEVNRLLDDPKSERFVASFTDQWLNLKEIDFTTPDRRLYRSFDTVVQASMLGETRSFFRELFEKDLRVSNLIYSDFSMLNERLIRFYRLENLSVKPGAGLQKVNLKGSPRGGLITHGAILKVTANGTTTSPVVRGVWVSERLLGMEIQPPPPNVPAVEPDIRGAVSIRDQLNKHRNEASCAACHRKIDPAGFALESFDPVGIWRMKYGRGNRGARVDSSGVTAEGQKFVGIGHWKKIYSSKPELLTEGFTKQFLTYATGAQPRFGDRDTIAAIVKNAASKEYGLRSILHAALSSDVFKTK
jgi:hypothetical protein